MRGRLFALPLGILLCASVVSTPLALAAPATPYQITVVADRGDALYEVSKPAKFKVSLKNAGKPLEAEVVFTLDNDGMPSIRQGKLKLDKNGSGVIEGTLKEPGFLRCRVIFMDKDKKSVFAMASAGFDPQKIPPSMPAPDDFDAFWAAQKARLAKVEIKPTLTPVKSPVEGVECFDVQVPCVDPRPVSGYFARPAGAKPKSLPAILNVHGAGVRGSSLPAAAGSAKQFHALGMDINAHGIPNGKDDKFYQELDRGELKGYRHAGRENRDTCYFLGMYLRLVRAIDFLTAQPEWDGRVVVIRGTSQGGGQSIVAAGLDNRVTFLSAGVPAMCDHSGKVAGRINGWPKLVPDNNNKPDPKVLQVARYFDCQNFAPRSKAQALVSVGFVDAVCPPTSVYAAYNALPQPKSIYCEPLTGHASMAKFNDLTTEAIRKHIAEKKK